MHVVPFSCQKKKISGIVKPAMVQGEVVLVRFRLGTFFGSLMDVKYHWMGYLLLALEAYHIMAG
jgi:hypothetical protein